MTFCASYQRVQIGVTSFSIAVRGGKRWNNSKVIKTPYFHLREFRKRPRKKTSSALSFSKIPASRRSQGVSVFTLPRFPTAQASLTQSQKMSQHFTTIITAHLWRFEVFYSSVGRHSALLSQKTSRGGWVHKTKHSVQQIGRVCSESDLVTNK